MGYGKFIGTLTRFGTFYCRKTGGRVTKIILTSPISTQFRVHQGIPSTLNQKMKGVVQDNR